MSAAGIMSCSLGWNGYQSISGSSCWPGNRLRLWGTAPISPLSSRQVPLNRCYTLSLEKTGLPSIQAHGGHLAKSKRFADDAQDVSYSSRSGGRSGTNSVRGPASRDVGWSDGQGRGGRYIPAAESVRRRF